MSFQSFHFLVFFLAVFALNRLLLRHGRPRKWMLLGANYYFYMCWDLRFCVVLAGITLVNYLAANGISRSDGLRQRRLWLLLALGASLGVLGFFKYANFFLDSTFALAQGLGLPVNKPLLEIVQPVGLSFFTFQALSYTFDVYRREQAPAGSLLDYSVFVSFFPTLLSGPVTRARMFIPQLQASAASLPAGLGCEGLMLILRGLVKKVVFADLIAVHLVDPAFAAPETFTPAFLLLALYGYTLQIYMDLSGYTDIARGVANLLGFELPQNFNRPYLAASLSNFWQRWHMSVSGFFRDYLFFSLGGSRYGNVYRNLMLTFIAIGAWHGAGWSFILYGALHGAVVCLERWRRGRRAPSAAASPWGGLFGVLVTFHFVVSTRVLFRADDLGTAAAYLQAMLTGAGTLAPWSSLPMAALSVGYLLHLLPSGRSQAGLERLASMHPAAVGAVIVFVVLGLLAFSGGEAPFIYFGF